MRRGRRARISAARKKTLQSPIRGPWRADASARIAAGGLFLTVLLIAVAALTVDTNSEPYRGEPPVIEDKLPGEDKPAAGCASVELGKPLGEFRVTAYCACARCCDKEDGITATGTQASEGRTIAVDPDVIPYGSTVTLYFADGASHTYTAEDCGGAIRGNHLDVYFASHAEVLAFGVRSAYVFAGAMA